MYHFLDMTVVCADSCCPYVTVVNCEFCITWLCCVQMFCCPTVRQVNDQLCEPDAGLCRFLLLTNCTEQSHVSTIVVHILLLRFEEIICTNHSHVHNVWPFARLEVWLEESCTDHSHNHKNLNNFWPPESTKTTVMCTAVGDLLA